MPGCEGDQHGRVLQLCGGLLPHHPHKGGGSHGQPTLPPLPLLPPPPGPFVLSEPCPCLPVPPLGLGLTMTGHFCRSSWNRSESSGTSPSTMACRISRRPWIGCSFRTPKWAISSLGSVPVHCSHVPHPRWAPRRTALGEQVTQPRRSVNQSEQEVASLPSSLGFPALSRAALFRPRKCLQRWGPRAGFSLDTHTLLLLHGPSCSPSPSCPLLCCPEVPSEVL